MIKAFTLRIENFDVTVNISDRTELLKEIHNRLARGLGFAVATVNLDHLVKLKRNAAFRTAYQRHDLVVADGNPIVWLSRLAGTPVSLVPGADLVEPLASLAARDNVAVALVGATSETLRIAADRLKASHPGLRIVACLAPGQGFTANSMEATQIIGQLRSSGAQFAFLALGAPRQEMFAARCREELPEMGFVSIGAGLDFIAASQHRAPLWLRRIAMEWAWRTLTNPRRLVGRYTRCALSLPHFVMNTLRRSST